FIARHQRQQRKPNQEPRQETDDRGAGSFYGIVAAGDEDNIRRVVAAEAVDPERGSLQNRAHQIEPRGSALVGALVEIRVSEERDREQRRFQAAFGRGVGFHRQALVRDFTLGAGVRAITGAGSSAPNNRHPYTATSASTRNVAISVIGRPIGSG